MSRSFKISVKENITRVIRAEDSVSTQLEMLEILPADQMAGLLHDELTQRGFQQEGNVLVRHDKGVTITIDPQKGTVTVQAELSEKVHLEGEKEGRAYDDIGPSSKSIREDLKRQLHKDLDKKAEEKEASLQGKVTDRLEGHLGDLRRELDQAVNRVTAEALKRKAATMGQIKEMTEDPQTGSLTIVVEV